MTEVKATGHFDAPPAEIWKLVGDFARFVEALIEDLDGARAVFEGDGVGMLRTVTAGTDRVVERLETHDEANWLTSHSMLVPGPFPVTDYHATIRLTAAADGGTDLSWIGTFESAGADEETAAGAVRELYDGGIAMLHRRFGG